MRDFLILFVHLIVPVARLTGPGGLRAVVAESVLVRHQLLILNRVRKRAPNLCTADRILAGLCALFVRPARALRSAIVLKPSTLLYFHSLLCKRKYRQCFSPERRCCRSTLTPTAAKALMVQTACPLRLTDAHRANLAQHRARHGFAND